MLGRLILESRDGRLAGCRPGGRCSTDSDYLMSTTLVCDASGAVAADLHCRDFIATTEGNREIAISC